MPRLRAYFVPAVLMLLVVLLCSKLLLTRVEIRKGIGSEFSASDEYARGWPWEFAGTRESYLRSAPGIRQTESLFFSAGPLAADVAVLLAGCGAIAGLLAWAWPRSGGGRQFSLRGLMLSTAAIAAGIAWWADAHAQWKREERMIAQLPEQGVDCRWTEYRGPRWLARLWPAEDLAIFHRVVEVRDDGARWPDRQPRKCAQALLAALPDLPCASRVVLHSQVAAHLTDPAACSSIEEVYLWTRGGDDDALAALSQWPHLRKLTIDVHEESDLSDRGLAHLANCPLLEDLYIPEGELPAVTDQGIARLADSKRLRRLTLPSTSITDVAMASLAKMTALESLSINRSSHLTDRGVRRLLESPTLKSVVVSSSQISDETVLELRRRLERVVVVGPGGVPWPQPD